MGSECLAECSHLDFDVVGNSFLIGESPALSSDNTYRMGFVEEEPRSMAFLQLHHFAQGSTIAIHAVNGFRDDENFCSGVFCGSPLEMTLQFAKVIVRKHTKQRTT